MPLLTFAVGDVHGCLAKLEALLEACTTHAAGRETRWVFLGDYIDRGPDSRGVIDLLMRRQRANPQAVVCLRGNHEQLAIDAHEDPAAVDLWLANKGKTTQRSYWRSGGHIEDAHLDWLRALPYCHDDGLRFFVHAGIDPAVPLDRQSPHDMVWIREPFLSGCDASNCGRFIVHGHTPVPGGKPDLRRSRVNLDTGAVLGGPLTAGVFDHSRPEPLGFLTDQDA
ncbi:MAG: metallophosphoesterase family protein [Xanthobacteraceae bacterium]